MLEENCNEAGKCVGGGETCLIFFSLEENSIDPVQWQVEKEKGGSDNTISLHKG